MFKDSIEHITSEVFFFSWLLSDPNMQIRSSYEGYQTRADIYINEVVSRVKHLQFYTASGIAEGGPIIMTQIENEFGHFGYGDDPRYFSLLANL